jgi:mxaJ protein
MSSPFRKLLFAAAALAFSAAAQAAEPRQLRVCADPDNLPYSNQEGAGFENKIAELIAQDLHATLEYDWWPQRRGFVRRTIGAGMCDLLIGVPADFERVATTRPYYRSTYVFVTRSADAVPDFGSPAIRERRIGVQLIGAALLWGPQAGWFAARAQVPLKVSIARPPAGTPEPFEFDVALGVKRGNKALLAELEGVLTRKQGEIDSILAQYHVPRTDKGEGR